LDFNNKIPKELLISAIEGTLFQNIGG